MGMEGAADGLPLTGESRSACRARISVAINFMNARAGAFGTMEAELADNLAPGDLHELHDSKEADKEGVYHLKLRQMHMQMIEAHRVKRNLRPRPYPAYGFNHTG